MKNKNQTNISLLGVAALIIALSIAYYFIIYIPDRDKLKAEVTKQEQEKVEKNRILLNSCLEDVDKSYNSNWQSLCKSSGKEENCGLPTYDVERVDKIKKENKEECFRKYPQ